MTDYVKKSCQVMLHNLNNNHTKEKNFFSDLLYEF